MVFQSYALYPHMTVCDNLAFGLRRRGVRADEIARRVQDVADQLGLSELLPRKPHALSGGQRQRVALGRAIVRDRRCSCSTSRCPIWMPRLRVSTRNEISRQQREIGTTTIYVTHDQVEAMTMGDRICIMNEGEVVQIGAPLDVYRSPANTFVARFLGNPPMNLLPAALEPAGDYAKVHLAGAAFDLRGWPPRALHAHLNRDVTLGVRPEDLYEKPPVPMPRLRVQVRAIESLGAETILLLTTDERNHELLARVGRDTALRIGDRTDIAIDAAAVHLFDTETGRAVPRQRP